jgi:hypothetical protein
MIAFGGSGMSELNQLQPNLPTNRPKRSRRLRLLVIAGLVVVVIAAVWLRMATRETPAERFKRQVREELPVGSTTEQVMAWAQRVGASCSQATWDQALFPPPPSKMLPEVAGVDRTDLGSFMTISLRWGWYTVNGEVSENRMWVFLPLDQGGHVKGHYFMTLAELAEDEVRNPRVAASP